MIELGWSDPAGVVMAIWVVLCGWCLSCWIAGVDPRPWKWRD